MRMRVALIISGIIVVGMFIFERIMMAHVDQWAERVTEISATERLLAGLASFWGNFWWFLTPAIVGFFVVLSLITHRSQSLSKAQ